MMKKGSKEAKEWGAKMKKARKNKATLSRDNLIATRTRLDFRMWQKTERLKMKKSKRRK